MRTLLYMAMKDLLLRWRDRLGFFWWMLGFPLLIAVLIGSIFSGVLEGPTRPMEVALADQAGTPEARDFVQILKTSGSVSLSRMPLEEARDAVRRGQKTAFVVLRPDFRISPAVFSGHRMPVAVGVDPLHRAESAYLQAALNQAAIELMRR